MSKTVSINRENNNQQCKYAASKRLDNFLILLQSSVDCCVLIALIERLELQL